MAWEAAGAIAEVIGAIAVIVSLWYLAFQLKQSTELAKADLEVQLGVTKHVPAKSRNWSI